MADAVITAENLTKVYQVFERQASTLKEMIVSRYFRPPARREHTALEGLNLRVERGAALGVIGPNGAGKSTLLKLIAGIIQPTAGRVETRGRVASLLELGAGFHPEFTGMENIFLQGRILGLSRGEILDRLDDIQAFSGLGKFIHTPVKGYSTGMIIRLGVALAAFFDADVFLVDEALSVGDAVFQGRCLERFEELRRQNKTVIFVSHELGQVEAVAQEVLWLEGGRARAFGHAEDVLTEYQKTAQRALLDRAAAPEEVDPLKVSLLPAGRLGAGPARIVSVEIQRPGGAPARRFRVGEPVRVEVEVEILETLPAVEIQLAISSLEEGHLLIAFSGQTMVESAPPFLLRDKPPGRYRVAAEINPCHFMPGYYILSCLLNPPFPNTIFYDMHMRLYRFHVMAERPAGEGAAPGEAAPVWLRRAVAADAPVFSPPHVWEEEGALLEAPPETPQDSHS